MPAQQKVETTGPVEAGPCWAWAPYEPDDERPWDLARAGHLLRRAGFGGRWDRLQEALADGPQATIDRLLQPAAEVEAFHRTYDAYEAALPRSNSVEGLTAWWLRRMIESPQPLLEKMTLFWHGYFATRNRAVQSTELMIGHVQRLRAHALGNYADLLADVVHDPAVLLALGAQENRRARPSEPFAEQLLAWCGLGPGQISRRDVHEAARALTGWFVLRHEMRFIEREHDTGVKRVLGHEGPFTGDDVLQIALAQQAAPRWVVGRLYRWLISETDEPSEELLAPLVEDFGRDYNIGDLVERMVRSNRFFSPAAYRQRVKSPVEFALGIIRPLERLVPTVPLVEHLALLGQELGDPPTSQGWAGGRYWINRATLLGRHRLAEELLAQGGAYGEGLDPAAAARRHGREDESSARAWLLALFLQDDVAPEVREHLMRAVHGANGTSSPALRHFARAVVAQPEFQLA